MSSGRSRTCLQPAARQPLPVIVVAPLVAGLAALFTGAAACADHRPEVAETYLPARVWLLTDDQHDNAIRDLLGVTGVPRVTTPGVTDDQFIHEAALHRIDGALLSEYRTAAEVAARRAVDRLDRILPCDPRAIGEDACARAFIDRWVPRAFRRPLDDTAAGERDQLIALFESGREDGGFAAGIGLVIEATLQSPGFLYRTELGGARRVETGPGDDRDLVYLTPHEIASAVSFLFLDSIPDRPLWDAASNGSLARPEVLAEHIERLLRSPRVQARISAVFLSWLGALRIFDTPKDVRYAPEFDDELRASMAAESTRFVHDVLWNRDGSLRQLLTSSRTFIDARLAELYGVEDLVGADLDAGLIEVELDPAQRAGILTHGSMLSIPGGTKIQSIVHRGLLVNRNFLCLPEPPSPPLELLAAAAPDTNRLDERERVDYRRDNPACSSCHDGIDPMGVVFEHYNLIGRWRADGVLAVADVDLGDGEVRTVENAIQLARLLAESDRVAACVVEQILHRAIGRELGTDAARSRREIEDRFLRSDRDLTEIFRRIPHTPVFQIRQRSGLQ